MFCSSTPIAKMTPEDVKFISGVLKRNSDEEQKRAVEETEEKLASRTSEQNGFIEEADVNPLTEDEESDTESVNNQQWPAWESTSEAEGTKADEMDSTSKWLKNCLVAVSPLMEFVALAEVQNLMVLERSGKNNNQIQVAANIEIELSDLRDYITAIQILPLGSTRRTETSQIDWTCIVVALASGWLQFYTERGILIFTERVADGPIRCLLFGQSFFPGNQELVALSLNCLYIMEGLSLFTVLKVARNEIARGERSLVDICADLPITAHCIQLGNLRKAFDFQLLGIEKPSLFDQHVAASQEQSSLRNLASISSHIYCSTSMSFATFLLFDSESLNRNVLSDTIHRFSSKIAAAVPSIGFRSFFGIGQSKKDRPRKAEVADAHRIRINVQSRLVDPGRHADRSFVSPGSWNLMAICDEKARVLLIDTKTRSVLRIWKGYRDARCAFIESTENTDRKQRKKVLFLAIFAPRRGILEVWSLRSGPRVFVLNVDPKGRLLTVPLPKEGILLGQVSTTTGSHNAPTAIFMESNGTFKIINVPFHFAALANANRLHDENLLRESNLNDLIVIVAESVDYEPFVRAIQALKTVDYQKRLLERMFARTSTGKLTPKQADKVLHACLNVSKFDLRPHLNGLRQITEIFLEIEYEQEMKEEGMDTENYNNLRDVLLMSAEEFEDLNLELLMNSLLEPGVPHSMYLGEFRDQVTFGDLGCKSVVLDQQADRTKVALHIFPPFLLSNSKQADQHFAVILEKFLFPPADILDLFIRAWQDKWNQRPWMIAYNGFKLLWLILGRFDPDNVEKAMETIEQSLYQSDNPRASLFLLLVYRAIERRKAKKIVETDRADDDQQMEWETWDARTAWHLLASRHLSIMSLIEEFKLDTPMGLTRLAYKGYGFYREQIGQIVAQTRLTSHKLIELVKEAREQLPVSDNDTPMEDSGLVLDPTVHHRDQILKTIFRQFPYSFATELLLSDCSWECASRWFKYSDSMMQPQRTIQHLELSIEYLSHVGVVSRLQHGLALMIWDTFIRLPFQNLISYVRSNEGRFPRDRLLRKEVFVTEMELPRLIKCVRQLLRILQTAVVDLEMMPSVDHKYEHFIEDFFDNRRIKTKKNKHHTLTEVASAHRSTNYHLVLHHIHLTTVIELQLLLNIRTSLDRLFPSIAQRAFFADFHEHPLIPISDVDDDMQRQRQEFMEDVVSAVGVNSGNQTYHEHWEMINELSKDWNLDVDLLRIREILMLHEGNFDKDAEKLYTTVQNRNLLASRLTPVAMGRFKALIESRGELKTKAPKKLKQTTWTAIRSLPDRFMPNFEPNISDTVSLFKSVIYMFTVSTKPPKEHYQQMSISNEKRLLTELFEFIQSNTTSTR